MKKFLILVIGCVLINCMPIDEGDWTPIERPKMATTIYSPKGGHFVEIFATGIAKRVQVHVYTKISAMTPNVSARQSKNSKRTIIVTPDVPHRGWGTWEGVSPLGAWDGIELQMFPGQEYPTAIRRYSTPPQEIRHDRPILTTYVNFRDYRGKDWTWHEAVRQELIICLNHKGVRISKHECFERVPWITWQGRGY